MGEGLNIKLIVFWALVIFAFAGLGIFGILNQDLVKKEEPVFTPQVSGNYNKNCSIDVERGKVEYIFVNDENNTIKTLNVKYTSNNPTQEDYDTANQIAGLNVLGVNTTMQGDLSKFVLSLYVNINQMDFSSLARYQMLLTSLNINILNSTSYDRYVDLFKDSYTSYTCDLGTNNTTTSTTTTTTSNISTSSTSSTVTTTSSTTLVNN